MATIDEFKAQLIGGGPRANRFKIFIPRAGDKIEFLAKAGNIPPAVLGQVDVQWRGHVLKLAGDRTFANWTVTILNDVEFSARTALEAFASVTSVSAITPIFDKIIFGVTSLCLILSIAFLSASLEP